MLPSDRRRVLFRVLDWIKAHFGGATPLHWLSVVSQESGGVGSFTVTLHEVDGRTYITDLLTRAPGWSQDARSAGRATLTTGRTDVEITLTEVTDPSLRQRVFELRWGSTPPESFDSFFTQVPSVFEVTPA